MFGVAKNSVKYALCTKLHFPKGYKDTVGTKASETANMRQCDSLNCSRRFFCLRYKKNLALYWGDVEIKNQRVKNMARQKYGAHHTSILATITQPTSLSPQSQKCQFVRCWSVEVWAQKWSRHFNTLTPCICMRNLAKLMVPCTSNTWYKNSHRPSPHFIWSKFEQC